MKCAVVIAVLLAATAMAAAQDGVYSNMAPNLAPSLAPSLAPPALSAQRSKPGPGASRAARPLPFVLPQQFAPPQEAYASLPESAAAAAPTAPSACQLRLAKIAAFQALPTLVGAGECGATDAVLIDTVILADQTKVAVTPPATLRCPMAEEIAHWLRDDVAPAVKDFGPPLRALDNFASYDCRGRNNIRAAQLSEHGRADALDVRDFKLADGRSLGLTDVNVAKNWRDGIRLSACARFSTVLGPGSDGFHEEHVHLDLAERHNGYKVCEWDVREPPPPVVVVQAQDAAPPADDAAAPADDIAPASDDTAPIPLDQVPLPRPRPVTQIERTLSGHHGVEHHSRFDGPLSITAQ